MIGLDGQSVFYDGMLQLCYMCITLCCVSNEDVKNALKNAREKKKRKHFQWHMQSFGKRGGGVHII